MEPFLAEHPWRPEPTPLRHGRHFRRSHWVRFNDASPSSPDRIERRMKGELCNASPSKFRIDEEARDSPEFHGINRRGHLAVGAPRVDPREFLVAAVLTPSDWRFMFVYQDRMRPAAADKVSLVLPISSLPFLTGRPSTKRTRPLIEDAPTSTLLRGERFKVREGANAQLTDREGFALHLGAFERSEPK